MEDNPNYNIFLSCPDAFDGSSRIVVFQLEFQEQLCNYDICFAWFSSSVVRCFGTWVRHTISSFLLHDCPSIPSMCMFLLKQKHVFMCPSLLVLDYVLGFMTSFT